MKISDHIACPGCGTNVNAMTSINADGGPRDRDISICAYCQDFLLVRVTGDVITLETLSAEDERELSSEERRMLADARRMLAEFREARRKLN